MKIFLFYFATHGAKVVGRPEKSGDQQRREKSGPTTARGDQQRRESLPFTFLNGISVN
jgi:hypothetical protein